MRDVLDELHESVEVLRIEETPHGKLLWLSCHPVPFKGLPSIESIVKANEIKQAIRQPWRFLFLKVPQTSYGLAAQEVYTGAKYLTRSEKLARALAFVVDVDQAYRFRIQDLITHSTHDALVATPVWELCRLMARSYTHEWKKGTHKKLRPLFLMAILAAIVLPSRWRNTIRSMKLKHLRFDDNDRYWASLKTDYRYD